METINYDKHQEIVDNEHLNLLSIFYFIYGGMVILGSFVVLGYITLFSTIFSNIPVESSDFEKVPIMGFFYIALAIFAFIFIYGITLILAGIYIRKKTNRIFSLIIGAIALISFPIGTTLGVFAIVVFTRASVIELYRLEAEGERMSLFRE